MKPSLIFLNTSFLLRLIVVILVLSQTRTDSLNKILFELDHSKLANDPKHDLNNLDYKNVMFSKDEITFYKSLNPNDPVRKNKINNYETI